MKDKILRIINYYGIMKQLKYIHSEYFELDQAIIDYENLKYDNISDKTYLKEHIAEEISDILVMLRQFQLYYDITDEEIEEIMNFKIDRQLERIENERNNI